MTELEPETTEQYSWYLSPIRVEQVGDVASVMRKYGASFEEIGEAMMLHFHSKEEPLSETTIYTYASSGGHQRGVVVITDHGEFGSRLSPDWDSKFAVAKTYGLPDIDKLDRAISDEMLGRGIDNYDIQRGEKS